MIEEIVKKWAEETKAALMNNLQKRRIIGQTNLITDIGYRLKIDNENVAIIFQFFTKREKVLRATVANEIPIIYDPLFRTYKPWAFNKSEVAFTRTANIFNALQDKYFPLLLDQVAEAKLQIVIDTLI